MNRERERGSCSARTGDDFAWTRQIEAWELPTRSREGVSFSVCVCERALSLTSCKLREAGCAYEVTGGGVRFCMSDWMGCSCELQLEQLCMWEAVLRTIEKIVEGSRVAFVQMRYRQRGGFLPEEILPGIEAFGPLANREEKGVHVNCRCRTMCENVRVPNGGESE
ncbi:hypothetical protein MA16_Dca002055 [Dendrobium catenatum]|uniref:Uncharacterized protein n=1 Tax=Dendrobium catenatum TaxID=906689 RepID=A0A2I0XEA6_9ASPA|nr:hypothetical protein MA16_Dca002055 [Dendrobium catenatum]